MCAKDKQKHKCCDCGKVAVWRSEGKRTMYYCDDCIHNNNVSLNNLSFESEGFIKTKLQETFEVTYDDILECSMMSFNDYLTAKDEIDIQTVIDNVFLHNRNDNEAYTIDYHKFMSKLGSDFTFYVSAKSSPNWYGWKKFYTNFKKNLSDLKDS